jgi:hypothetical protein
MSNGRKPKFTDAEFAAICAECATVVEVIERTGYNPTYVLERMRTLGSKLTPPSGHDQRQLAALLEAYCAMSPEWRQRAHRILRQIETMYNPPDANAELASGDSHKSEQ